MNIRDMVYRTQTYIAGDWDGDRDAVDQLKRWNNSNFWRLSFYDVHEKTQSLDTSLNCNIKRSLQLRMDVSKRFVLVVGDKTNTITSGSCGLCPFHTYYYTCGYVCNKGYRYDSRSYVKFECDKAVDAGIEIIVLYNSTSVDINKCPSILRDRGCHIPMKKLKFSSMRGYFVDWDYEAVKKAFGF